MNQQALGLIEVIGMTGAIEAADVCLKSANVQLIGCELSTGGLVTVKIEGNIGAVKVSIDAAKIGASKICKVVSTLVIPRPAEATSCMVSWEKNKEEMKSIPKSKNNLCNLCGDPLCSRKKGQPRDWCMHYKEKTEGDINDESK